MYAVPSWTPPPWRWLVVLLALCGVSCSGGDKLHSVQGKIIHKDQPVEGALVTFHRKGATDTKVIPSTGVTKADGSFTLTTGDKEGAAAGEYVVTVICSVEVTPKGGKKMAMSMEGPDIQDRFQGAYADPANSKITVEIKAGPNQLEPFHLK